MTRGLRTRIMLSGMLALALLGCTSCIYVDGFDSLARYEEEVPLSAPLEPGSSFTAQTRDGSITIEGAQTNECSLKATIVTRAMTMERAEELAAQIDVRLEPAGRGLRLVIDRPPVIRNSHFSVSLHGTVPVQTDLTLSTRDGSINIANITGAVAAETSDGGIDTQNIDGDARLKTSDGRIACVRLKAHTLDCRTHDGSIRLSDATAGSLIARTSDGGVTLESVRADTADVRTDDGAIRWRDAVASRAECHSDDGAIEVEYAADAPKAIDLSATASDGSITLIAPPELSAVIDVATDDGSIRTDLPILVRGKIGKSLQGTVGGGEGRIYLRTNDGSITIR